MPPPPQPSNDSNRNRTDSFFELLQTSRHFVGPIVLPFPRQGIGMLRHFHTAQGMHRRSLNLGLVVGKKSIQEDASIGSKSRTITIPGAKCNLVLQFLDSVSFKYVNSSFYLHLSSGKAFGTLKFSNRAGRMQNLSTERASR